MSMLETANTRPRSGLPLKGDNSSWLKYCISWAGTLHERYENNLILSLKKKSNMFLIYKKHMRVNAYRIAVRHGHSAVAAFLEGVRPELRQKSK